MAASRLLLLIPFCIFFSLSAERTVSKIGKSMIVNEHFMGNLSGWVGKMEVDGSTIEGSVTNWGPVIIINSTITGGITVTGKLKILQSTIGKDINVTGHAALKNATARDVEICGSIEIEKSILKSLTTVGKVEIADSTIQERLDITGKLKAKNAQLGDITIFSDEVELTNTTTGTITVREERHHLGVVENAWNWFSQPKQGVQTVTLSGNTIVKRIIFESGKGRVIIKGNGQKIQLNDAGKPDISGGTIFIEQQ